jgi:hypothetical protein
MPSLTWKLIALLTLIFAVAVFLWFIFLGPLSRCDRLIRAYVIDERRDYPGVPTLMESFLERDGCLKGTKWDKDG